MPPLQASQTAIRLWREADENPDRRKRQKTVISEVDGHDLTELAAGIETVPRLEEQGPIIQEIVSDDENEDELPITASQESSSQESEDQESEIQ